MPVIQVTGEIRRPRGLWAAALVLACLTHPVFAQAPPVGTSDVQPGEQIFQIVAPSSKITIVHLDTKVIEMKNRISIVDGFNPDKVAVTPLSPHRVRVRGENPGITTLKLIDEFDGVHVVEVFVEPDTRELKAYLERLFPGSAIEVVGMRDAVVLRGWVTDPTQIPQIIDIAEEFYPTVHPQLHVAGASQVQLHVKVMEVQRTKLREMGVNFLGVGQQYYFSNAVGALAPVAGATLPFGGPPNITINQSALANPEFQFGITGNSDIFQGFVKFLLSESLAKILAEPVLVTTSGRPAFMHSGGEFPVPVPQGLGTVGIEWKEFGVRLEFVPIVLGNGRLRLDVAPEVSERDFANAQLIGGELVTGIFVRRVNTQVEMRFGETFMIGGLISTRRTGTTQKVPFLGELPWIGAAFSRKRYDVGETELVILVTPQLAGPMLPHQVPFGGPGTGTVDPTDKELFFDGMLEIPNFGPECPDCEPHGGIVIPHDALAPGLIMPPAGGQPSSPGGTMLPPPVESAARRAPHGGVMQASGSGAATNSATIRDEKIQPAANQTESAPKSAEPRASRPENDARIPKGAGLPGLIPPSSGGAAKR